MTAGRLMMRALWRNPQVVSVVCPAMTWIRPAYVLREWLGSGPPHGRDRRSVSARVKGSSRAALLCEGLGSGLSRGDGRHSVVMQLLPGSSPVAQTPSWLPVWPKALFRIKCLLLSLEFLLFLSMALRIWSEGALWCVSA